jgi:hypothetical protein
MHAHAIHTRTVHAHAEHACAVQYSGRSPPCHARQRHARPAHAQWDFYFCLNLSAVPTAAIVHNKQSTEVTLNKDFLFLIHININLLRYSNSKLYASTFSFIFRSLQIRIGFILRTRQMRSVLSPQSANTLRVILRTRQMGKVLSPQSANTLWVHSPHTANVHSSFSAVYEYA